MEEFLTKCIADATERLMNSNDYNLVDETEDARYFRHRRTGEVVAVDKIRVREVK